MKKTMTICLTLLFILSLSLVTYAASRQVTGDVTAVDPGKNTITVQGKKGTISMNVTEKTKILQEDVKTLNEVQVGNRVTAEYSESGNDRSARKITVKADKKKKTASGQ